MIEKQLIQALEPLIDDLTAIEKRVETLSKMEGPRGLQGEPGLPGADAIAPEATEIADVIKADEAFIEVLRGAKGDQGEHGIDGKDGADGISPEPEEIAEALKADEIFVRTIKGDTGDIGPQGDAGPQGERGEDAVVDYDAIVKSVVLTEEFSTTNVEAIKSMMAAKFEEEMNEVEAILYG